MYQAPHLSVPVSWAFNKIQDSRERVRISFFILLLKIICFFLSGYWIVAWVLFGFHHHTISLGKSYLLKGIYDPYASKMDLWPVPFKYLEGPLRGI
jgi:hypothetical protein